ncbi:MAG: nodulation protein NfeD [Halobacteria archaeon]
MRNKVLVVIGIVFSLLLILNLGTFVASGESKRVLLIEIKGNIGPSVAEYVREYLEDTRNFEAVIMTIDTFGGLGDSMFQIIDSITYSDAPVIVYVYPEGGQALSAGTYILMASSLAAMAPYTIIGSAQPVVNGVPSNDTKLINFLVEKMHTLARMHGRNETQAARFVTHNDNLGPEDAFKRGIIEIIAKDITELLQKANGRTVKTIRGERTLDLSNVEIIRADPGIRYHLLSFLSDPLVSGLLLSLCVLVLIVGLSTPGFGAELVGGIMIILGLIGQGFNLNWAGLALIILGSILVLYEFYSGGIALAMISGVVLIGLGLILIVRAPPGTIYVAQEWLNQVMSIIIIVAIGSGAIFSFILLKGLRTIRRKTYSLVPQSEIGRAVEDIPAGAEGYVIIAGEYRRVIAREEIKQNQRVRVIGQKNNYLIVEPYREQP